MIVAVLAVLVGFLALVWAADRFVLGAAAMARNLGVSPLIIGLTIVGFGTSAPEMLVSAIAAWQGNPAIGIGNALGSNITNIGLVLGITALFIPLTVKSETLKREFPILFAIMLVVVVLLADGNLSRLDGIVLFIGLSVMVYWLITLGLRGRSMDPMIREYDEEVPKGLPTGRAIMWLSVGLVTLLVSSRAVVWGAVYLAQAWGISDLVIGLTIIAIGTSLPELAASVMGALKKEHDIAIGNVMGSNMFNLLAVLGLPGLINPGSISAEILVRDVPVMIGLTLALFAMAFGFGRPGRIGRWEGVLLLLVFIGYQIFLYSGGG